MCCCCCYGDCKDVGDGVGCCWSVDGWMNYFVVKYSNDFVGVVGGVVTVVVVVDVTYSVVEGVIFVEAAVVVVAGVVFAGAFDGIVGIEDWNDVASDWRRY